MKIVSLRECFNPQLHQEVLEQCIIEWARQRDDNGNELPLCNPVLIIPKSSEEKAREICAIEYEYDSVNHKSASYWKYEIDESLNDGDFKLVFRNDGKDIGMVIRG